MGEGLGDDIFVELLEDEGISVPLQLVTQPVRSAKFRGRSQHVTVHGEKQHKGRREGPQPELLGRFAAFPAR